METSLRSTPSQRHSNSVATHASEALDDLKGAVHHGEEALKVVASSAADKLGNARNHLASSLDTAKSTYARLQDQAIARAKETDKVVREHPYQSLGLALAVGLLIGVLIKRK